MFPGLNDPELQTWFELIHAKGEWCFLDEEIDERGLKAFAQLLRKESLEPLVLQWTGSNEDQFSKKLFSDGLIANFFDWGDVPHSFHASIDDSWPHLDPSWRKLLDILGRGPKDRSPLPFDVVDRIVTLTTLREPTAESSLRDFRTLCEWIVLGNPQLSTLAKDAVRAYRSSIPVCVSKRRLIFIRF